MYKRLLVFISVFVILVSVLTAPVSAQEYSTEYPSVYNSGSPLWIHCNLRDYGDYVILLDPETDLQAFGFDAPTGYNLINNTASTINGRAYATSSTAGYTCRWLTYYCLQFRVPTSMNGYEWRDVYINDIYGTTMNFVDHVGDRGNDMYKHDLDNPGLIIVIVLVIIAFILVYQFHFKSRLMRL